MTDLIVTMDGPAGTGKSTVSRAVAKRLALPHLDTGAFYRAAGLAALRAGVDLDDGPRVASSLAGVVLEQVDGRMLLDGDDVSVEIRRPDITRASSQVSTHPEVRNELVSRQRDWVERHGNRAVVEGRDIGSVVFPEAAVKVYLDARPEVRAQRRASETGEDYAEVLSEIKARDHRDSTRSASPLTVPSGAVVIDTSEMTSEQVVDHVLEMAARHTG